MLRLNTSIGGSNRTFMELKLGAEGKLGEEIVVLIVPLWNWNRYSSFKTRKDIIPQFGIVQATNPSCLLYFP